MNPARPLTLRVSLWLALIMGTIAVSEPALLAILAVLSILLNLVERRAPHFRWRRMGRIAATACVLGALSLTTLAIGFEAATVQTVALRIGITMSLTLWFMTDMEWPELASWLRARGVPADLLEYIDLVLLHGYVMAAELARRRSAAYVRGLLNSPRYALPVYGHILEAGVEQALERSIRLETTRVLRAPSHSAMYTHDEDQQDDDQQDIIIEARALSVKHDEEGRGIEAIDFVAKAGECIAIAGASGSGKTTLLHTIAGLHKIHSGELLRFSESFTERGTSRFHPRIALVFQNPDDQFLATTAMDDLIWCLTKRGESTHDARQLAMHALETLNIIDLAERPIRKLSFGQRKLVALAGALATRPRLLLFDEPTSGLDPRAASRLIDATSALVETGVTIVWATHDLHLLPAAARRICLITEGRLIYDGPIDKGIHRAQDAAAGL